MGVVNPNSHWQYWKAQFILENPILIGDIQKPKIVDTWKIPYVNDKIT